jgi:ParB family chromosome partitioning protein
MAREELKQGTVESAFARVLGRSTAAGTKMMVLKPDQIDAGGRTDRKQSLKKDWPNFLASHRTTAETAAEPKYGNIQPVIVMGAAAPYKLVAGQRRVLAAKELGLHVNAIILPKLERKEFLRVLYWENSQRVDLTPFEAASQAGELVAEGFPQAEIAEIMGKGLSTISLYLKFADDKELMHKLSTGKLSLREAQNMVYGQRALLADVSAAVDFALEPGGSGSPAAKKAKAAKRGETPAAPKALRHNDPAKWDKEMVFHLATGHPHKKDVIKANRILSEMRAALHKIAREGGYADELKVR